MIGDMELIQWKITRLQDMELIQLKIIHLQYMELIQWRIIHLLRWYLSFALSLWIGALFFYPALDFLNTFR